MKVIDASALVAALVDDGATGERARDVLRRDVLAAPALIDFEVGSGVRRLAATGRLALGRASAAMGALPDTPVDRISDLGLLARCWELRDNVTFYDAAYVALAEALDAPLVTADARLANAPGPRCAFVLLS